MPFPILYNNLLNCYTSCGGGRVFRRRHFVLLNVGLCCFIAQRVVLETNVCVTYIGSVCRGSLAGCPEIGLGETRSHPVIMFTSPHQCLASSCRAGNRETTWLAQRGKYLCQCCIHQIYLYRHNTCDLYWGNFWPLKQPSIMLLTRRLQMPTCPSIH